MGVSNENMFLEAFNHGLIMHEMAGFDIQKARVAFNIRGEFEIGIMISYRLSGHVFVIISMPAFEVA